MDTNLLRTSPLRFVNAALPAKFHYKSILLHFTETDPISLPNLPFDKMCEQLWCHTFARAKKKMLPNLRCGAVYIKSVTRSIEPSVGRRG